MPDVVEASTGSSGGGTTAGVEILGGGNDVSINPLGLLGDSGGVTVGLPALGGAGGSNGSNGNDGNDGNNGSNGSNGGNGSGTNGLVINYFANANGGGSGGLGGTTGGSRAGNGGSGGSFVIPPGISSRLQGLLRILAERDYLRISNGRAVCLNSFGVAEIASSIPRRDWAKLQQALSAYSDDIFTLRQLLANCRSRAQRQALNLTDLNRVIALDVGADGRPVLYML